MTADSKRLYSLIGLCQKAGRLVSGGDMVEEAICTGRAKLVIIALDAGETMAKRFRDKAAYYEVPVICFGTKEELGRSIGKELRSAVAMTDAGFSGSFIKKYQQHPGVKD